MQKKFLKSPLDEERLWRELKIHSCLNHPNIIKFHASFEKNDNIYLIQDYAASNLFDSLKNLKKLPEEKAFSIFFQVCMAVDVLHKCGIIHRDIKVY